MQLARTLMASAALAALAGAASAAVINGGFEDVSGLENGGLNRPGYGVYTSIPGWTTLSEPGIELQNNDTLPQIDAHGGNWYVELDSDANASMYQDISFASAGQYILSFWYAPRTPDLNNNGISWAIGNVAGAVTDVFPNGWREVTSVFTVANAGDVLRLVFAATELSNGNGGLIDDVSVTQLAPVPLPAAGMLLMGGLAGLGAVSRRRRTAA